MLGYVDVDDRRRDDPAVARDLDGWPHYPQPDPTHGEPTAPRAGSDLANPGYVRPSDAVDAVAAEVSYGLAAEFDAPQASHPTR